MLNIWLLPSRPSVNCIFPYEWSFDTVTSQDFDFCAIEDILTRICSKASTLVKLEATASEVSITEYKTRISSIRADLLLFCY